MMREYSRITHEQESLAILGHGVANEDPVRTKSNKLLGTTFFEVGTIIYKKMPGLACNVDGLMYQNGKLVKLCEIKCPIFQPYKDTVAYGRPPISHFVQCQINMNIVDCEEIYYIMCHIPSDVMKEKARQGSYEACKRRYYHRYLCQKSFVDPDVLSEAHTAIRKYVDGVPLAEIPKIGLLYCISIKRNRVFWNYITAKIKRFWNHNVLQFVAPVEDASTGKRTTIGLSKKVY